MTNHRNLAVVTAVALCFASLLFVAPLHAGPTLYIDDDAGRLGTVDVQTGTVNVLGTMSAIMFDIAFAPNGDLYAVDGISNLWKVNPATAQSTLVGASGVSGLNALVFSTSGTLYSADNANSNLYSVNPATGAATSLGNIGVISAGDLAFKQGVLYLSSQTTNELVKINFGPVSGTQIGPLGFPNVYGMATGDNGVLYGVSGTTVFSINTTTGAGTAILDYSGHGLGAANGTSFFNEAPEPSTLTLAAFGVIGLAAWGWRRKPFAWSR